MIFFIILISAAGNELLSQTIHTYDFGTGTASYVTPGSSNALTPPSNGNAYVYIASNPNGGAQLKNPGLTSFGSGSKLMVHSSASGGSANKFSIWGFTGGNSSYVKFSVVLADSLGGPTPTSGIFYFCTGNGTGFQNNNGLSPSEILSGIKWTIGSTGTISTKTIKAGNSWQDITLNPFFQGQSNVYTIEVFGNNSFTSINYTYNYISYNVAPLKQDIFINGVLCADDADVSGNGLTQGAVVNSFMFYVEENAPCKLCAFIDNISYLTAIAPNTTTYIDYYSKPSGNLELLTSWTSNLDGSGSEYPSNFSGGPYGNSTMNFHLANRTSGTIGGNWAVTGQNCMLIVGSGTEPCTLNIPQAYSLNSANVEISNNGVIDNHNAGSDFGNLTVFSGGIYIHDHNGGAIPLASWNDNSTCLISGITGTAPSGFGQNFNYLLWNNPGQTQSVNINLPSGFGVAGNFAVTNTGDVSNSVSGRTLQLVGNTDRNATIEGDLILNGGNLTLTSGTGNIELTVNGNTTLTNGSELYLSQSGTGTGTLKLLGNASLEAGSIITVTGSSTGNSVTFANTGIQALNNDGSISNVNYNVNSSSILNVDNNIPVSSGMEFALNGTLYLGIYNITGSGNFALNSGGTLGIGSADGINNTGSLGNIQNSGLRTFSTAANYIYNGQTAQVTGSGLPAVVNNITFDNSNGIILSSGTSVNGNITLTNGVIDLTNNNLEILPAGTITGSSASNYFKTSGTGTLRRTVTSSSALFPVGNGTYSPVILSNSGASDIYSVSVKNTFDNPPADDAVVNKQWTISEDLTGGGNVNITLQWNLSDESALFNRVSDVYIGRWNGSGWSSYYGGSGYSGSGPFSISSVNLTSLSNFIIANESALPVGMTYFTASVKQNDVMLLWGTSFEINNSGFEIYRADTENPEKWVFAGFVKGKGTTNVQSDYMFTDKKLSTGKYKYRLKQMDLNGNSELFYLNTIAEVCSPKDYSLSQNYPNPFNPITSIAFETPAAGHVTLTIYDMLGREVQTLVNEIKDAGYYTVEFNGTSLASGIYFFRIQADNYSSIKRMILVK